MKYLCAVYLEPNALQDLTASQLADLNRASISYNHELTKSGHYIAASALQPTHTAKTVRRRAGKVSITDGPFSETKEVLGGFILLEAANIEEALQIAAKIPVGNFGAIEVRPELKID
jgi:hypothetical protein